MTKKDEMMQAALELFSKEGYDNVGVQRIVDTVNVKKPTLYYYFKNKEGLLEEILKEYLLDFLDELEKISKYDGDIIFTLEKIISHYYKFSKDNIEFYRLMLALSFSPDESQTYISITKYNIRQYSIIEKVFLEAEKQHGNMIGRSKMYAFSFIGTINSGISYYFYKKEDELLSEESARKLCKQYMYGIFS